VVPPLHSHKVRLRLPLRSQREFVAAAPGWLLRLRVYLSAVLAMPVPAGAGNLFALPGRDIQAGFRFTVRGNPNRRHLPREKGKDQ